MIGGSLILCWMRERPWTQDRHEIAELMSDVLALYEQEVSSAHLGEARVLKNISKNKKSKEAHY